MLYYLIYYTAFFLAFFLIDLVSKKQCSSLRVSLYSFIASSLGLISWNFFLGSLVVDENLNGGVSILLSTMLAVVLLFFLLYVFLCCIVLFSMVNS